MENYFFSPLRFHWGQVRKFHHRGAGQGRAGAMGCWNRRLVKTGWCMLLWKRWLMVDVFTWWFDMMVDMVGLVLTYEKIYCEMPWLIYDLTWFSVWCLLKKYCRTFGNNEGNCLWTWPVGTPHRPMICQDVTNNWSPGSWIQILREKRMNVTR